MASNAIGLSNRSRLRLPDKPENSPEEANAAYCAGIVRRHDPDRWLALSYASPQMRAKLIALYALQVEIRQIPGAVSEPPLGEIRLQWWRDALDEVISGGPVRAHPVVSHARSSGAVDVSARGAFEDAIDARARLLYGAPFTSVEALIEWADTAEGFVARLRGGAADHEAAQTLIRAESAFVLAREMTALAPALVSEISIEIKNAYAAAKPLLKSFKAEELAAHLHLALTPQRLSGGGGFAPVRARLRLFTAMATGRL